MMEALRLGPANGAGFDIKRVNRLPVFIGIALIVGLIAVVTFGLASRGSKTWGPFDGPESAKPASTDADRLKRGIPDGIIADPSLERGVSPPRSEVPAPSPPGDEIGGIDAEKPPVLEDWRVQLEREHDEQILREFYRQRLARVQADDAAKDAPINVDVSALNQRDFEASASQSADTIRAFPSMTPGGLSQVSAYADLNGQAGKASFLNQASPRPPGFAQQYSASSPYVLKRGSIIPATLITGINSDLPGNIIAQVSQPVFDSATGRHLLIPQGTRLLGRYDANVSFGQERVLVIWTDLSMPDGSSLEIAGMAGTDASGYGGFSDKVDHHTLRTFASAALVAMIGVGTELLAPNDSADDRLQNAAGRSFAETFGEMSSQASSKHLNVQPTIEIRPGYQFNIIVDTDLSFDRSRGQ